MTLVACLATICGPISAIAQSSDAASNVAASVEGHQTRNVHGWTVHVSDALLADRPQEVEAALPLIEKQLGEVARLLPAKPLAAVRTVPIWLSPTYDGVRPTAEYHPNAGWLKQNGRRPALVRSVELTNVSILPREHERMPMLMLHELAHAYHHQTLGFDDPRVIRVYDAAKQSGRYDAVRRRDGPGKAERVERAYAITNHKEYFAESTEAYFGRNDFFPYTREELKRHDPRMHDLVAKLWAVDANQAAGAPGAAR
ncbi:metallopeptidase [Alienimonas chondri]|uniref:Metallopeptidase n=1 Tax=Alienimonas chondri TaxID=2681879 RepID=A0ABX1V8C2_9PLAN|nr:metallopeptidase [Alienimonas chondri]NNJ24389.1 hypothetical protein [Alienimonas chondri]